MSARIDRRGSAELTLPSDTEIRVVRHFDAPADLVFEAWTSPEHIRNWWGFEHMPMEVCDVDLRVGGDYRFTARLEDGTEIGFHGTCLELDPPHRHVATEVFEGMPDAEAVNTMTLEEHDGVTTMTITTRHTSQANRDAHVESGMESGLQVSLDRLERITDRLTGRTAMAKGA